MKQNDFSPKLIETLNLTNKTNHEGFEKIAGQLYAINETLNDCFEAFHDLYMIEKEKVFEIKQIAGLISDDGLARNICRGIRHGLFGQDAPSDASFYDIVNALILPLSEIVNSLDTLAELQSREEMGNQNEEAGKQK